MSKENSTQKAALPKLVKLDKAFKLAEQWVNNMTKSTDESAEVELEGRPARLGLGSTVPRQSKIGHSNDPVERKLLAKLNIGRINASKKTLESTPSARDGCGDSDDDEDDLDSRTNAFAKKRPVPLTSSLQVKKKKKK
ncbi:uncharacterized protein LOC132299004 [Cornus florida]|uniref:uncharacterized protein LOC132299004 n=1 Tax=Cornus florida TaxID=4283 RepID=UPI0028A003D9|nr:uncharacterized protein LOC132299004 [Cornus florida]XP_059651402.1 uncharacterized protein LOC132299004 [Cornus florida]XP_059651403.1 uncharacterized protein LOC132299004 [Cornus florida]